MNLHKFFQNISIKKQLFILLIVALTLNINTLFNEYALDDIAVFTENTLVTEGIKGIPQLFATDMLYGYTHTDGNLSGGRYRPLSLVVFAIEYQFFGINPFVSHLINVILFTLLIALLFKLLQQYVFKEQHPSLAFVTCLLFVVHPVHTEAIAYIKSRDELITLLLLLTTSFAYIHFFQKRTTWIAAAGLTSYFFALLTKESAVSFIVVLPLVAYFFFNQTIKKSIQLSVPLIAVLIAYIIIRLSVIGIHGVSDKNVLNFPFLYANASEAFATKVVLLFKYVWLLFYPNPLICDYGYNDIQYIQITSFSFIFSALILFALISYAIYTFKRKSLFSFCILYFMITIFLIANFVIDLGAFLAERLLFQPSLAFCIFLASVHLMFSKKYAVLSGSLLMAVLLVFSILTIKRNGEWKNDRTLHFADISKAPNSMRINANTAIEYINLAKEEKNPDLKTDYYKKAVHYDEKVLSLYYLHRGSYINLGYSYIELLDYFKAADNFKMAYKLSPSDPESNNRINYVGDLLYNKGNKYYRENNADSAIICYKKAIDLNGKNADAWHNLSKSYLLKKDTLNFRYSNDTWQMLLNQSHH